MSELVVNQNYFKFKSWAYIRFSSANPQGLIEPINCFALSNVIVWANIVVPIFALHPKTQLILAIRYSCLALSISFSLMLFRCIII